MYKIYINDTPLFLASKKEFEKLPLEGMNLTLRYTGKDKQFMQIADLLEKSGRFDAVFLYHDDLKLMWKNFKNKYKIQKAAGGLVFNEKGEILVMYRRGVWDLPKGKIDPGETKKVAAVREVEEETGIENIDRGKRILKTFHTFRRNDKRILKVTYWYKMTAPNQPLTPQTEEDIEKCEWVNPKDFLENYSPIYGNIQEVVLAKT